MKDIDIINIPNTCWPNVELISLSALTFTAVTVSPALVLPTPVVKTDLGITFEAYFRNCDLPVPEIVNIIMMVGVL